MAEVMSFVDFAHQYCGEGGVQWGFGIKGTTGGDEVKVLPDISKANSAISYYFLCPNGMRTNLKVPRLVTKAK